VCDINNLTMINQVRDLLHQNQTPVIKIAADAQVSMKTIYDLRNGSCKGLHLQTLVRLVVYLTGKEPKLDLGENHVA